MTQLFREEELIDEGLREVARKMVIAARTAPKGRGDNNMVIAIVEKEGIQQISRRMKEMGEELEISSFVRDAENILNAPVMVLFGSKIKVMGLKKCGMCGFSGCEEKSQHALVPCVFNTGDLGIAIGSAVSIATDHRVDNRVMYTAGQAVIDLELLGDDVKIVYTIPLSATSKNPFFDRK